MPYRFQFSLTNTNKSPQSVFEFYKLLVADYGLQYVLIGEDVSNIIIYLELSRNLRLQSFGKSKFKYEGELPTWDFDIRSDRQFFRKCNRAILTSGASMRKSPLVAKNQEIQNLK